MGGTETTMETLRQRLDGLERAHRWWRRAMATLAAGIVAAVLMGQARPTLKVVEAEKVVLRDASGKVRVVMDARDDRPGLKILDSRETVRVAMDTSRLGSGLFLYDLEGRLTATLRVLDDGTTRLYLNDGKRGSAELGVGIDGGPWVRLFDRDEKASAILSVAARGSGLGLSDQDGKERVTFSVAADGRPALAFFDRDEKPRAGLGITADGRPGLRLYDQDGRIIWHAP